MAQRAQRPDDGDAAGRFLFRRRRRWARGLDASTTTVDRNGGYPSLAPPTTRAVELIARELGGGFTIPRHGSCGGDLEAELSRVSSDGDTAWIVDVPWSTGSPLADGEVVVGWFSAERDGVYAVDLATGERLWQRFYDDRSVRSGVVVDGVVALSLDGTEDNAALLGLDARTGEERWRREVLGLGGVVAVGGAVVAQPAPGLLAGFDPEARSSGRSSSVAR